jgi:membrane-associated phospholipid phosphatase
MATDIPRQAHGDGGALVSAGTRSAVRWPLLLAGVVLLLVFGADTAAAAAWRYYPWDVPVAGAVQSLSWGPLLPVFAAVDWLEGVRQVALTVLTLGLVAVLNRRALPFGLVCALSGAVYSITEILVARPRPPAGIVHVLRHTNGYSYPSGHATFFSWWVLLVVLALIAPHLPRALAMLGWLLMPLVLVAVAIGRVYVGEHWPSDVLGGLALGLGWASIALAIRWLSDPLLEARRPEPR